MTLGLFRQNWRSESDSETVRSRLPFPLAASSRSHAGPPPISSFRASTESPWNTVSRFFETPPLRFGFSFTRKRPGRSTPVRKTRRGSNPFSVAALKTSSSALPRFFSRSPSRETSTWTALFSSRETFRNRWGIVSLSASISLRDWRSFLSRESFRFSERLYPRATELPRKTARGVAVSPRNQRKSRTLIPNSGNALPVRKRMPRFPHASRSNIP